MKYCVAKTPSSGFIGDHTLEEIIARLHSGALEGNYLANESTGASFTELQQSSSVEWNTLTQLLRENSIPWPPDWPLSNTIPTRVQHGELELLQQLVSINQKQLYWIRLVGIIILFSWIATRLYAYSHHP